jgi:hypothetical protein
MFALANLPKELVNQDLEKKVGCIVEYVIDSRFQALEKGYGLVWYESNKRYYSCGWKPELPCLNSFDDPNGQRGLLLYMDLMSHFEEARKSAWLQNCVNHLESFRTENGTIASITSKVFEQKMVPIVFLIIFCRK